MTLDEIEVVAVLLRQGLTPAEVLRVWRLSRRVARLAVEECNRPLTEREKHGWAAAKNAIVALLPSAICHGDPRGYVVKLPAKVAGARNELGGDFGIA